MGVNLAASYRIMKNSNLKGFAQELRNNQTDAEKEIWSHLRQRQMFYFKFRRQQIIGNYIVDFICFEKQLIIEIDGRQHSDITDKRRTDFFEKEGYKILRFWNNEVLSNIEGVMEKVLIELNITPPS